MIKNLPRPIISEENDFKNQFWSWLHNSHYWIEGDVVSICKWCKMIMPNELSRSILCRDNPEIKKERESAQ